MNIISESKAQSPITILNANTNKIDIEYIIQGFKITNTNAFKSYLKEIWLDLSKQNERGYNGISLLSFSSYYKLPGIISLRLFKKFCINNNDYICFNDFIDNMCILFCDGYNKKSRFVFDFYDFNKDGKITKEDIHIILSYVTIVKEESTKKKLRVTKNDSILSNYFYRVKSQEKIYALLDETFEDLGKNYMEYKDFLKVIENKMSDIFIIILLFLLDNKPFTMTGIVEYEKMSQISYIVKSKFRNVSNEYKMLIASPSKNESLFISDTILQRETGKKEGKINKKIGKIRNEFEKLNLDGINNVEKSAKRNDFIKFNKTDSTPISGPTKASTHQDILPLLNKNSAKNSMVNIQNSLKNFTLESETIEKNNKENFEKSYKKMHKCNSTLNQFSGDSDLKIWKNVLNNSNDKCEKLNENNNDDIESIKIRNKSVFKINLGRSRNKSNIINNEDKKSVDSFNKMKKVIFRKNSKRKLSSLEIQNFLFNKIFNKRTSEKNQTNIRLNKNSNIATIDPSIDEPERKMRKNSSSIFHNCKNHSTRNLDLFMKCINKTIESNLRTFLAEEQGKNYEQKNDEPIPIYSGYLYKKNSKNIVSKIWYKLVDKDLYYFSNIFESKHKGMHNLSGTFINELAPQNIKKKTYHCFSLISPNNQRLYFCENLNQYKIWVEYLKRATNFHDINENYEIGKKLGKGKFGLVKLGIEKNTKKEVAIKILDKLNMRPMDMELVRNEIETLKICQHPNIIHLYNVCENCYNFYIIMEYCSAGNLSKFIQEKAFNVPEKVICKIIHQLLTALYYMHYYGIVHRDIKPDNILLTSAEYDKIEIRILDFGLSKIISPNEKCSEPFGTLIYVAPEILMEEPYNQSVDCWSIGILTYYLFSGEYPFDSNESNREIARKIIYNKPKFSGPKWDKISKEAIDFIEKMLEKSPNKRMTAKQALDHTWIKKYNDVNREKLIKNSNKPSKEFKVYTAVSKSKLYVETETESKK